MGERTLISAENEAGQCALCEPDVEGMMNDLISRKALCDYALNQKDKSVTPNDIMRFPSAQPEPKWIPVSERLPETEEFVLASLTGKYRNTTFEHACEIADYADGEWCVYAYPHMSAEKCEELIEAWMPLPEPYKGGEQDG